MSNNSDLWKIEQSPVVGERANVQGTVGFKISHAESAGEVYSDTAYILKKTLHGRGINTVVGRVREKFPAVSADGLEEKILNFVNGCKDYP